MAELKKLTLTAGQMEDDRFVEEGTPPFSVMINPASYNHSRQVTYSLCKAQGAPGTVPRFSAVGAEEIDFSDIVIDGTGVVADPPSGPPYRDVKTQIQQLTAVAYKYVGQSHEPPVVKILWGSLIFYGFLQTMTVDYTLFKPSGEPLRAKVKLKFKQYLSPTETALRAKKSSPDLSHRVEVRAGDTLPLLCYRIYKDSSYYLEVARVNQLGNFRQLTPGTVLTFPPLV